MSGLGYVQAGYVVALGGLFAYAGSLVLRERVLRRRLDDEGSPSVSPAAAPDLPPGLGGRDAGEDGGERPATVTGPRAPSR